MLRGTQDSPDTFDRTSSPFSADVICPRSDGARLARRHVNFGESAQEEFRDQFVTTTLRHRKNNRYQASFSVCGSNSPNALPVAAPQHVGAALFVPSTCDSSLAYVNRTPCVSGGGGEPCTPRLTPDSTRDSPAPGRSLICLKRPIPPRSARRRGPLPRESRSLLAILLESAHRVRYAPEARLRTLGPRRRAARAARDCRRRW